MNSLAAWLAGGATLLFMLWPAAACAAPLPAPASPASALVIGRITVPDLRQASPRGWSRITVVWQGPLDQSVRVEAGHDGVFVLPNLEAGEYALARLVLVREPATRGPRGAETLSLALPLPWTVRAPPGAAVVAGELAVEIRADRTIGMSVVPLTPSAHALVAQRLAGSEWAERPRVAHEPPADRPGVRESLGGGSPQVSGPDQVVLPYRGAGRSLVVEAAVNGRRSGRFLLDTGASVTVISRRLAREAGVSVNREAPRITLHTANGAVQAPLGAVASLGVSGLEARGVIAAIHDLPGVGGEIDGLLGMNFLRHFRLTIDPDRGELTLSRR